MIPMKMGDKPGMRYDRARERAHAILGFFELQDEAEHAAVAGSVRREVDVVGDIDIVVATTEPEQISDAIAAEDGFEVLQRGPKKVSVAYTPEAGNTHDVQVDFTLADPDEFGAALLYMTGSAEHNISMRRRAADMGYKLNEYGLHDGDETLAAATEQSIYQELGLPWYPPTEREHGVPEP